MQTKLELCWQNYQRELMAAILRQKLHKMHSETSRLSFHAVLKLSSRGKELHVKNNHSVVSSFLMVQQYQEAFVLSMQQVKKIRTWNNRMLFWSALKNCLIFSSRRSNPIAESAWAPQRNSYLLDYYFSLSSNLFHQDMI